MAEARQPRTVTTNLIRSRSGAAMRNGPPSHGSGGSGKRCGSSFDQSATAQASSIKTQGPFRLDVLESFRISANFVSG